MKDYISFIEKNMSDKKHIIITGTRGSGKSTLLKEILSRMEKETAIPGIITWCERGKAVYMRQLGNEDSVMVGKFNPESTSKENRMNPVPEGFNGYGVAVLDELIKGCSEWIAIDEIGYLETSCQTYLKKLDEVFDEKRVIAVVRKQETEYICRFLNRRDALVIDLDEEF